MFLGSFLGVLSFRRLTYLVLLVILLKKYDKAKCIAFICCALTCLCHDGGIQNWGKSSLIK